MQQLPLSKCHNGVGDLQWTEVNPTSTVIGTFWPLESANSPKLFIASLAAGQNT